MINIFFIQELWVDWKFVWYQMTICELEVYLIYRFIWYIATEIVWKSFFSNTFAQWIIHIFFIQELWVDRRVVCYQMIFHPSEAVFIWRLPYTKEYIGFIYAGYKTQIALHFPYHNQRFQNTFLNEMNYSKL